MKPTKNKRTIGAWKLAHSPLHATAHPGELMTYRHNRLQVANGRLKVKACRFEE